MWKCRISYLALTGAAVIAYIAADRREALVLLCLLVLVPFLSGALQTAAMKGIEIACHVQDVCRMGQKIDVNLTLRRNSRLPLGAVWAEIVFENILYGDEKKVKVWLLPDEHKKMAFVYPFETEDCGNMKIRMSSIECRDLTGLFVFRRFVEIQEETLIYPPEIKLSMELMQRPETKSFGDMYDQNKRGQDVSEVSGLRDYVPGDMPNSIHWKLSGKMDELIVREFGNPSNYNTLILYEMMKRINEAEIPKVCNNAVLALTVSLSRSMLELNLEHNVGRVLNRDFQTVPVYSVDTCEQMQLNILCMPIAEEGNGADMVYSFFRGNLRNDYTKIIYITPYYEEHTARRLSREVDLTVIQVAQGRGTDYTASAGYTLISVDADTYRETMHSVAI